MNAPSTAPVVSAAATHGDAAIMFIRAQTALHPGAGSGIGVIDLPIEREPHTNWPAIPGSSIKGVLRDAARNHHSQKHGSRKNADGSPDVADIFGTPTSVQETRAGALSVSDARILLFPVRSMKGVFAWVTCVEALRRFARDAALTGVHLLPKPPSTAPGPDTAWPAENSPLAIESQGKKSLLLEEFDFSAVPPPTDAQNCIHALAEMLFTNPSDRGDLLQRLVVLNGDDFTHFVRHSTHVRARIAIDYDTKIVREGALFYEEFLPPETIMYSMLFAASARSQSELAPSAVLGAVRDIVGQLPYLQIGAGETTGCGICTVAIHCGKETK
jgi:CRISPR-associated protein Cmr4